MKKLKEAIAEVPDFPKPGINFKDLSPAFADSALMREVVDESVRQLRDQKVVVNAVAGIESRGFILGPMLAQALHCPFIMIRKPGKLPGEVYRQSYALEYGTDALELQKAAIPASLSHVLIHDDLLATGGTAAAAAQLVSQAGASVSAFLFLVHLAFLPGLEKLQKQTENIINLVAYE